jgi:hypothetical protein
MKYLSVVLFAILMIWTWFIVHKDSAVSFETHAGIQNRLSQLIVETVQSKKPLATDISVDNVWTELTGQNSVKAHFSYQYKESSSNGGQSESHVQGEGSLVRQSEPGASQEKWKLSDVKTTSDSISFDQPLIITTGE